MGNQHATTLAWLAGIMDGEGSIMVIRTTRSGKFKYTYRVTIANTDLPLVMRCKKIFADLQADPKLYNQDRGSDGQRRRRTYLLHIMTRQGIQNVLEAIYPFLTCKKQRAKELLKALAAWESVDKSVLHARFRLLNERIPVEPSETTREKPQG